MDMVAGIQIRRLVDDVNSWDASKSTLLKLLRMLDPTI